MKGVVSTPFAVLFILNTIRIILLVLFGRIVAALAICACHGDQSSHESSYINVLSTVFNAMEYHTILGLLPSTLLASQNSC